MENFNISSNAFMQELLNISTDIIWKNQSLAYSYEDPLNSVDVEQYMAAMKGVLTFDTIFQFDYDVLSKVGLSVEQIKISMEDKQQIPEYLRTSCTTLQLAAIKENYVEKNNYYRMLFGLPDIEDTVFVYNTEYPDISDAITPIHELPLSARISLENYGYMDILIKQYPTKKYLLYSGIRNISPYIARMAERFAILWMNSSTYANLTNDFVGVYDECRHSINRVYYSDAFRKDNAMYEGFLGMCVLFMTIQLMHYKYLDVDITRDFYDLDSIRYIYSSYGVPFYQSIPLEYHTQIVKNINILLSYKGSTRVFFELFDLFDYGMMDVYEYYLLKTHRFENGKPVFVKKEDGSYDNRAMYDIKFGRVRLYDNPPMELSNSVNHIDYNSMTVNDPYWVSDPALLNKLYDEEEFNYLEAKYVGIQTVIDMMKIMYEATYYFKIVFDNRPVLELTDVYFNAIGDYVSIFDIVVYVSTLVCKKYGYSGNISSQLPNVSKVMGWDFKANMAAIKAAAVKDKDLKTDTALIAMLNTMDITSLASVNTVYGKITDLRKYLIRKMSSTHNKTRYQKYYQLYNTLMYSSLIESVYKKSDGTTAETFDSLLEDINPELYSRLSLASLDISAEIDDCLIMIKKTAVLLRNIEMADGLDISGVIEYLFKILDFFKSAKSELTGYNIIYTLSSRGDNTLKFFGLINNIHNDFGHSVDYIDEFVDSLTTAKDTYQLISRYSEMLDRFTEATDSVTIKNNIIRLTDKLKNALDTFYSLKSNASIKDFLNKLNSVEKLKDSFSYKDLLFNLYEEVEEIISAEWRDTITIGDGDVLSKAQEVNNKSKSTMSMTDKLIFVSSIPE